MRKHKLPALRRRLQSTGNCTTFVLCRMATQQVKCLAALALVLIVGSRWMGPDRAVSRPESTEPIYILTCAKNLVKFNHRLAHLARMFDSILKTARRRPLNWIIPTLPADVPMIHNLLERIKRSQAKVPVQVDSLTIYVKIQVLKINELKIQVDYIDLDLIKRQYPEFINASRQFFLNTKPLEASVYWDEVN